MNPSQASLETNALSKDLPAEEESCEEFVSQAMLLLMSPIITFC